MASETVEIPGAVGGSTRVLIEARYDYEVDKCRCPNCGGLGIPWGGWFTCDDCLAVAVVADGRCFALLSEGVPR